MSQINIKAESRTEFGKGAARRIRRADKVPAVLYGHGNDPLHVTLPGHELMLALKTANALLSIELDGKSQLALPKQVQRDPIKGFIEHADLLVVRRGEKVTVAVPVVIVGNPAPESLVVTEMNVIQLEAEATHLPVSVEVSIEGLTVGSHITAGDVTLPEGSTLQVDPEHLVVHIIAAPTAEEIDAELAEAEAEVGIEREESEAAERIETAEAETDSAESGAETGPDSE
ncbi:MAG: 50S ribosomal protein L25/general stress protein Ctc [Nocardioidaceae bacterium]